MPTRKARRLRKQQFRNSNVAQYFGTTEQTLPSEIFIHILLYVPAYPFLFTYRRVSTVWKKLIEQRVYNMVTSLNFCGYEKQYKKLRSKDTLNWESIMQFLNLVMPNIKHVWIDGDVKCDSLQLLSNLQQVHLVKSFDHYDYMPYPKDKIANLYLFSARDLARFDGNVGKLRYCESWLLETPVEHEIKRDNPNTIIKALKFAGMYFSHIFNTLILEHLSMDVAITQKLLISYMLFHHSQHASFEELVKFPNLSIDSASCVESVNSQAVIDKFASYAVYTTRGDYRGFLQHAMQNPNKLNIEKLVDLVFTKINDKHEVLRTAVYSGNVPVTKYIMDHFENWQEEPLEGNFVCSVITRCNSEMINFLLSLDHKSSRANLVYAAASANETHVLEST